MAPRVYEVESGRPASKFVKYPNWKCPRCGAWHMEPVAKVCRRCKQKEKDEKAALDALEDGL